MKPPTNTCRLVAVIAALSTLPVLANPDPEAQDPYQRENWDGPGIGVGPSPDSSIFATFSAPVVSGVVQPTRFGVCAADNGLASFTWKTFPDTLTVTLFADGPDGREEHTIAGGRETRMTASIQVYRGHLIGVEIGGTASGSQADFTLREFLVVPESALPASCFDIADPYAYEDLRIAALNADLVRYEMSENPCPRVVGVVASLAAFAEANPQADAEQVATYAWALDSRFAEMMPGDPKLLYGSSLMTAVRFGPRFEPVKSLGTLKGLKLDVGARALQLLGIDVRSGGFGPVDGTGNRVVIDRDVQLGSLIQLDALRLTTSNEFWELLVCGGMHRDASGNYHPGLAEGMRAYLANQGHAPVTRADAPDPNHPVVAIWLNTMPASFDDFEIARRNGFAQQASLAKELIGEVFADTRERIGTLSELIENRSIAEAVDANSADAEAIVEKRLAHARASAERRSRSAMNTLIMQQSRHFTDRKVAREYRDFSQLSIEANGSVASAQFGLEVAGGVFDLGSGIMQKDGFAAAASLVGIASSVLGFVGDSGPSVDEQIYEQVKELRQQVEDFRQEMHDRFDQIDSKLNRIYDVLAEGFADLKTDLVRIDGSVRQIQKGIAEVKWELRGMEERIMARLSEADLDELRLAIADVIGYRLRTNRELDFSAFASAESLFRTKATTLPSRDLPAELHGLMNLLTNTPGDECLPILNRIAAELTGNPLGETPPNPTVWSLAADSYAQLAEENPWYFASLGPVVDGYLDLLIERGNRIARMKEAARGPFLDTVIERYETRADELNAWAKYYQKAVLNEAGVASNLDLFADDDYYVDPATFGELEGGPSLPSVPKIALYGPYASYFGSVPLDFGIGEFNFERLPGLRLAHQLRACDFGNGDIEWFPIAETLEQYSLQLASVGTIDELADEGVLLVVVALVAGDWHVRVFDGQGSMVIDDGESTSRGLYLEEFRPLIEADPIADVEILKETDPAQYTLIMERAANAAGTTLTNLIEPVPAAIAIRIHPGGSPSRHPVLIRVNVERVEYLDETRQPPWKAHGLGTPAGRSYFFEVLQRFIGPSANNGNRTKLNDYFAGLLNSPDSRPTPGTYELPSLSGVFDPSGTYLTTYRISFSDIEVIGDDYWVHQAETKLAALRASYAERLPTEEEVVHVVDGFASQDGIIDGAQLLRRTLELAFPAVMERSDVLRASFYGVTDGIPGNAEDEMGLGEQGIASILDGTPLARPGDLLLVRLARVKEILAEVRNEAPSPHSYVAWTIQNLEQVKYFRRHLAWGETFVALPGPSLEVDATRGLLANDRIQGEIRAEIVEMPDAAMGSLSAFDPANGSFVFDPAPGVEEGTARFTYRLRGVADPTNPYEAVGNVVRVIIRISTPSVAISRSGPMIEVSWPIGYSSGLRLHESRDLGGWEPCPERVYQSDGRSFVRILPDAGSRFWSLR